MLKLIQKYKKQSILLGLTLGGALLILTGTASYLADELIEQYYNLDSPVTTDRYGRVIHRYLNEAGNRAKHIDLTEVPEDFQKMLLTKEDQWFYYHPGLNPWSALRAGLGYAGLLPQRASSTLSQQLVKVLLGQELSRTLPNKLQELFYTFSLELFQSKEQILEMYLNTAYFGNQAQGIAEASQAYFNLPPELLTKGEFLQLLTTLSSPTENNPTQISNIHLAKNLAKRSFFNTEEAFFITPKQARKNLKRYLQKSPAYFEISSLLAKQAQGRQLTIDRDLTQQVRGIVQDELSKLYPRKVNNAAVIIIKLPENEVLALIGSPDPTVNSDGYQIDMLQEARPIGSTAKPFIYAQAFAKGLRPYTIVEDREYKYITALGFPLYPKNYDYQYRGPVTLHYALSNSLNVPAVKVLEYVGLESFYTFLTDKLGFQPVQDLSNYQLGIALGALEMKLIDLAHYFTIFPNQGELKELRFFTDQASSAPQRIIQEKHVQLVNKILSDRRTGSAQFGYKSILNLPQSNYAFKTGTSRDFRDSWIVGYTPDFLVATWVGNADNSPMDEVSGQVGAAQIWSRVMEFLFNSPYNHKTPFSFDLIQEFSQDGQLSYGLPDDDYSKIKNLLIENNRQSLIVTPHPNDIFNWNPRPEIPLKARQPVDWYINNRSLAFGQETIFRPQFPGTYTIRAEADDQGQEMKITVVQW